MKKLPLYTARPVLAAGLASLFLQPMPAIAWGEIKHVLLLSIDGFHAVDLEVCVAANTCPNLAALSQQGITYTNASTTKPSDSFPGLLAQLTGGTSKSFGVFYDDSYDRTLFSPAGHPPQPCMTGPGVEVTYAENVDTNLRSIDGGVAGSLTGLNSAVAIDPNNLPGQKASGSCSPCGRTISFAPTPSLACFTSTDAGLRGQISTRPMTSSTATSRTHSQPTCRAPMSTISSRRRSTRI